MGNSSNCYERNEPEYWMSSGLKHVGFDIAESHMEGILKHKPQYIVSVGTGDGVFEKLLCNNLQINIICVDPAAICNLVPKEFVMAPHYSYVTDLIERNPKIVGNCVLILNWCEPNSSTYDYEAIQLLIPQQILWIGESLGGAGGEKFLEFYEETKEGKGDYRLIDEYIKEDDCFGIYVRYTIATLGNAEIARLTENERENTTEEF
jgi:hypothetical protein